jgi:hypothetical protein
MKPFQILPVLSLCACSVASAQWISPDSATANSEFSINYLAVNTINGSGLPSSFTPDDAHADYAINNHWTIADSTPPTDASITWGFDTDQSFGSMAIWNHQSNGGIANDSGYEPTLFDLFIFDENDNLLLSWDDVSIAADTATGQTFSFGSLLSGIRSVQFDVEAVQGSTQFTGLAEVAFSVAVPEPSSFALILSLSCAFAFVYRRRTC